MRSVQWNFELLLKACLLCAVLAGSFACATLRQDKHDEESFMQAVEQFNTAIRWQEYKKASLYIAPQQRHEFWEQTDRLQEKIRITDYEIRPSSYQENSLSADVSIRYRYYVITDPCILTKTLNQHWQYLEEQKMWQIAQSGLETLIPR